MAVQRIEWACPRCGKRFAIPANIATPDMCPKCRQAEGDAQTGHQRAASPTMTAPAAIPPAPTSPVEFFGGDSSVLSESPSGVYPNAGDPYPPVAGTSPVPTDQSDEFTVDDDLTGAPYPTASLSGIESSRKIIHRKYPALKFISMCYKILAVLVALGSIVALGICLVGAVTAKGTAVPLVVIGLSSFGGGLLLCLSLFALGELIQLFLDIESNTRTG